MTYKQIEASRERRLWIGQVIVPAIAFVGTTLANPDVRNYLNEKVDKAKRFLKKHKKKEES